MIKLISGSRPKAEAELLHAIWTDSTHRYKILLKRLYPAKPSLFLIKKSIGESATTPLNIDNLSSPSDSLEI